MEVIIVHERNMIGIVNVSAWNVMSIFSHRIGICSSRPHEELHLVPIMMLALTNLGVRIIRHRKSIITLWICATILVHYSLHA